MAYFHKHRLPSPACIAAELSRRRSASSAIYKLIKNDLPQIPPKRDRRRDEKKKDTKMSKKVCEGPAEWVL